MGRGQSCLAIFILLEVPAHIRATRAAAAHRTIAQELLSSPGAIDLADVNVSVAIDSDNVRPVKLACLTAATSKATQFCQILPVDDLDCVIKQIGDEHASLLRVGREVHRT